MSTIGITGSRSLIDERRVEAAWCRAMTRLGERICRNTDFDLCEYVHGGAEVIHA